MTATCIGCGCDEAHGCPFGHLHVTDPCWWLRFDAKTNTGVCSACDDLAGAWDKGERAPLLEVIALRFYRQAMQLYRDPQDAIAWMRIPQPLLGGRSPSEAIRTGQLVDVQRVLFQILDGAFA